jgi:mannose-6-phosphate isomerase
MEEVLKKNDDSVRPWGHYTILQDTWYCKVKEIVVEPEKRLSYQYHHHRQEHWTVVGGTLIVILDDVEHTVKTGESISIPKGSKHRAWNKGKKYNVKFIEVQTGTYFGEDDIVRVEDDFNRE